MVRTRSTSRTTTPPTGLRRWRGPTSGPRQRPLAPLGGPLPPGGRRHSRSANIGRRLVESTLVPSEGGLLFPRTPSPNPFDPVTAPDLRQRVPPPDPRPEDPGPRSKRNETEESLITTGTAKTATEELVPQRNTKTLHLFSDDRRDFQLYFLKTETRQRLTPIHPQPSLLPVTRHGEVRISPVTGSSPE